MGDVDPLIVDCYEGDLGGKPDWAKLIAAGPPWHGAIIKASEGLEYHSTWFREQWPKLRELAGDRYGVDWFRGAYHYARVAEDPIKQAHVFLGQVEQAGGWDAGDLWPMVDVESSNNPLVSTRSQLEAWISTYAAEILLATGRRPTLYGNIYLWQSGRHQQLRLRHADRRTVHADVAAGHVPADRLDVERRPGREDANAARLAVLRRRNSLRAWLSGEEPDRRHRHHGARGRERRTASAGVGTRAVAQHQRNAMTVEILVPLLAAIIGCLVYALSQNAKVAELGRLTYGAGLLVTLFEVATHVVKL